MSSGNKIRGVDATAFIMEWTKNLGNFKAWKFQLQETNLTK